VSVGRASVTRLGWSNCAPLACNTTMPIYCFQQ